MNNHPEAMQLPGPRRRIERPCAWCGHMELLCSGKYFCQRYADYSSCAVQARKAFLNEPQFTFKLPPPYSILWSVYIGLFRVSLWSRFIPLRPLPRNHTFLRSAPNLSEPYTRSIFLFWQRRLETFSRKQGGPMPNGPKFGISVFASLILTPPLSEGIPVTTLTDGSNSGWNTSEKQQERDISLSRRLKIGGTR